MPTWRDFTPEQRDDLLRRKKAGEDLDTMAREIGLKSVTLRRNLQLWERKRFGEAEEGESQSGRIYESTPDANHKVMSSKDGRIKTVEDLLESAQIDLDEWVIEKSEVNTWEGYRKADRKNISWADGRIQDGYVDDDGTIVTKTLYQVKIWLVRRKPIAIEPVVTPVRISVSPNLYTFDQDRNETHVALFVPDMHIGFEREYQTGKLIPFHDRRALSVVAKIISLYPFDQIVFLGDNLDMADWSDKFARTPDFEQLTQPAIEELAWWLGLYRHANSETDMTYLEGNHEKRQEIMVSKHLPQAYHLKNVGGTSIFSSWSIPSLLGLEDLSIEWVGNYPDGSVWLSDTLVAVHGDSLSAQKIVESTDASVVFGHLHRFDQASKTRFHRGVPKIFTALCPGFLGKLDGAVPGSKKNQNWSQGLALAYYTDEEPPTIVHIPVRDGKAIVEGTIIEGDDLTDFILDDLDNRWNF